MKYAMQSLLPFTTNMQQMVASPIVLTSNGGRNNRNSLLVICLLMQKIRFPLHLLGQNALHEGIWVVHPEYRETKLLGFLISDPGKPENGNMLLLVCSYFSFC